MPNFLAPFPPTLTPTSESQAFSRSSFSLSSNSSFNYFGHHSHASSSSAYLTDITPPTTPHTSDDKGHGKSYNDHRTPVGSCIDVRKSVIGDRERLALLSVDEAEDTGYNSDCEREDAPLLDAVEMVRTRLKKAKPTVNTQRALKIMEENMNPESESDALLDEPLLVTPSTPTMKVVVTKAEGGIVDRTDSEFKNKTKAETTIPPVEEVRPTPTLNFTFLLNKDEIWRKFGDSEFEKAFHEGVREDMGRSFFPDEIKLHPADTFAFGTGSISGWREKPVPVLDAAVEAQAHTGFESLHVGREMEPVSDIPVEQEAVSSSPLLIALSSAMPGNEAQVHAGFKNRPVEREMEPVSDIPVEQEAVPSSPLLIALSPAMPGKPVLRALDDLDWTCSSLYLSSPSLVFDTSVSVSQMLISPQNLGAAPMVSSPGVYDISNNNPNSPLNSPLVAISTLMFSSRRSWLPPADMATLGQNLDLPDLMRLEIAAGVIMHPQQQQLEAGLTPGDRPSGGFGLGFDIHPSQLPDSSFPSCNSLPSIYSLPSWDAGAVPTTSTPPLQACRLFDATASSIASASEAELAVVGVGDVRVMNTSNDMEMPSIPSRQALSDITEESTRGVALANEPNEEKEPSIVGLGLGSLLESTLQSSSSISVMRSPELPPPPMGGRAQVSASLSASVNLMDVVDGCHHLSMGCISDLAIGSSAIFEHDCSSVNVSNSKIEPSSVFSEMPQEIRHYSPGVENWRRFCAEVEPLTVPLDSEVFSSSPNVSGVLTPGYCYYSEIDPHLGLSEGSSVSALPRSQALAVNRRHPLSSRYSPERNDIAVIDSEISSHLLTAETDPRSPVSSAHQIHHTSSDFGIYASSPLQPATTSDVQQSQSPDFIIEEVSRIPASTPVAVLDLISCVPPAERSKLKSRKSVEGIGIGMPSNLAGRPPRPHDVSSNGSDGVPKPMMATAEECQNLVNLASSSPTSDSASPNFTVSEERNGSRFFFKIPKFAKRSLYAIPEALSPGSSPGANSSTSGGRLLSAAWSDLTNRLRSPSRKSGLSKFPNSTPQSTSPLAGASGDAISSDDPSAAAITQLSAIDPDAPSSSEYVSPTQDISQLPQPPVLVPRRPRFAVLERLSGFSGSPPVQPIPDGGGMSPGVVEHLHAPRGLGIFKRNPSPITSPSDKVKLKGSRFKPVLRKFQLLF